MLLRPLLVFLHFEAISGALGKVTRGGHIGKQHEAARLFLPPGSALCLGSDAGLQPLPHGLDRTGLVGARPAAAIPGPFLNGDV